MKRAVSDKAKESRKEDLMESALELFAKGGFNTAKISDITEKAGLSTGTFYIYFDSKTDIYRELYLSGLNILQKLVDDAFNENINSDLNTQVTAIVNAYCQFYWSFNKYYKILYISYLGAEQYFGRNELVEKLDEKALYVISIIEKALCKAMEIGSVRKDIDSWTTAVSFWGFLDGILFLNEKGNIPLVKVPLEKIVEQALDIVLTGIKQK